MEASPPRRRSTRRRPARRSSSVATPPSRATISARTSGVCARARRGGRPVRFADLCTTFERLEATSKRLEMRSTLVELIRPLRPPDLGRVLYLAQGLLRPEYEGIELGMADSLARRAVATAAHAEETDVARRTKESGDLGTTTGELLAGVRRLEETPPLRVAEVYAELTRIAEAKGAGSQDTKVQILSELLVRASPLEGKFIVRFVLGTLRVGVREMTILDALAEAFGDGTKAARQQIEAAFNLSSDLELVAGVLVEKGVEGLATVSLEVGRPMRAMLAEREPNLAAVLKRMDGRAALEIKYDGLRVQAHIPKSGPVRLFSRRLEEISAQFPELVEELPRAVRSVPAILEGECVPIDPDTDEIQPFQQVSRRRGRKHDPDGVPDEVPACLFPFAVSLLGGTPSTGGRSPNGGPSSKRRFPPPNGCGSRSSGSYRARKRPGASSTRRSPPGARGSWPSPSPTGAPTVRAPVGSGGSSTSGSTPPASPIRSMGWWWAVSRGAAGGPAGTGPSCSPSTTRSSIGSRASARSAPGSTTPSSPRCPAASTGTRSTSGHPR